MRRLIESLDDLAGYDVVLARGDASQVRPVPPPRPCGGTPSRWKLVRSRFRFAVPVIPERKSFLPDFAD